MKKILSVSEMKQIRGGAQISSFCGEGEKILKLIKYKQIPVLGVYNALNVRLGQIRNDDMLLYYH